MLAALRQAESGTTVGDVCRQVRVSDQTFCICGNGEDLPLGEWREIPIEDVRKAIRQWPTLRQMKPEPAVVVRR